MHFTRYTTPTYPPTSVLHAMCKYFIVHVCLLDVLQVNIFGDLTNLVKVIQNLAPVTKIAEKILSSWQQVLHNAESTHSYCNIYSMCYKCDAFYKKYLVTPKTYPLWFSLNKHFHLQSY